MADKQTDRLTDWILQCIIWSQ